MFVVNDMLMGAVVSVFVSIIFGLLWKGVQKYRTRIFLESQISQEILVGMYMNKRPWGLQVINDEITLSSNALLSGEIYMDCIARLEKLGYIKINESSSSTFATFYLLTTAGKAFIKAKLDDYPTSA